MKYFIFLLGWYWSYKFEAATKYFIFLSLGYLIYRFIKSNQRNKKNSVSVPSSRIDSSLSASRRSTYLLANQVTFKTIPGISSFKTSSCEHVDLEEFWVPSGKQMQVQGFTIPGGLLYIGQGLASVSEPALINPSLKASTNNLDREGQTFSYLPSYSQLQPSARGAYLEWLANGRNDPGIGIGYVFLFFYGLERRLLAEAEHSKNVREECQFILNEVERLLNIYGNNGSFRSYASHFLDFVRIRNGDDIALDWNPDKEFPRSFSTAFKVRLGQLSKQKLPIPCDLAMAWWMNHPETRLRSPVTRCPQEFTRLFEIEYKNKFGKGLIVKPNRTPLSVSYKPASASFGCRDFLIGETEWADLTVLSSPVEKLMVIAESCIEQLESYSRLIGRNPGARGSLSAISLLPKELLEDEREKTKPLLDFLVGRLREEDPCAMDARDLLAFWMLDDPTKVAKVEAVGMAQLLASMGTGMEPDIRSGAKIHPDGKVCLFRLSAPEVYPPTTAFQFAEVVLHLAAVIAGADGIIDPEEERQLELYLESTLHLADPERERLRARVKLLLSEPPGLAGIKNRLSGIATEKYQSIREFLVVVAGANGWIGPSEVKTLKKIYGLLGVDPESIHADIHHLQTRMTGQPVPVAVGNGPSAPNFMIPPPSDRENVAHVTIQLDPVRVAETLKNTALVQQMLADVFVEDAQEPKPLVVVDQSVKLVPGLDGKHSELFRHIIQNSQWVRADFDAICDKLGLMSNGAIETINEAAFMLLDEPVLEGDNPLDVNQQIAQEMLA